jgi:hypothetical protein
MTYVQVIYCPSIHLEVLNIITKNLLGWVPRFAPGTFRLRSQSADSSTNTFSATDDEETEVNNSLCFTSIVSIRFLGRGTMSPFHLKESV